jgi:LEA14-like dessication related protein
MKVLLAAMALALLVGCASTPKMEPLDVTLSDIVPAQMGILEQQYQVKLRVQNPNNFDIPLEGVAYQIDLNDKAFAKGVGQQSVTVPKFGEAVLDVTAVSSLSGVLAQLSQLTQGGPDKLRYRVKGKLYRADGTSIPFDQLGEIQLSSLAGSKE